MTECTMCEDCVCEPGGERWQVDVRTGHGPQPYGPECVAVARGLSQGRSLLRALDEAGMALVWDLRTEHRPRPAVPTEPITEAR